MPFDLHTAKKTIQFIVCLSFAALFAPSFVQAQSKGAACTVAQENFSACHLSGCFVCKSQVWVAQPLHHGTTTATCTSALAGSLRLSGSSLEICTGSSWVALPTSSGGGGGGTTPVAFAFSNQYGVATSSTISSDAVVLTGFSGTVNATCGSGCTSIAKNGTWIGAVATGFYAGDTIQIRQTSSATQKVTTTASVTVGTTTSETWRVTTLDPCEVTSPSPGTVCADGTLYAGLSPDGNVKMFTTRCDRTIVWNGSSCSGTRSTNVWGTQGILRGLTSSVTGKSNSATLAAVDASSDAGKSCENLVENGYSDWYLPAKDELQILYNNRTAIGNFDTSGTFWSSTEGDANGAYALRFSDGYSMNEGKVGLLRVRCVRR